MRRCIARDREKGEEKKERKKERETEEKRGSVDGRGLKRGEARVSHAPLVRTWGQLVSERPSTNGTTNSQLLTNYNREIEDIPEIRKQSLALDPAVRYRSENILLLTLPKH